MGKVPGRRDAGRRRVDTRCGLEPVAAPEVRLTAGRSGRWPVRFTVAVLTDDGADRRRC
jgi:hypothetical protein